MDFIQQNSGFYCVFYSVRNMWFFSEIYFLKSYFVHLNSSDFKIRLDFVQRCTGLCAEMLDFALNMLNDDFMMRH